jgi:hypothetical protein
MVDVANGITQHDAAEERAALTERLLEPGVHDVDASIICRVTRLALRHPFEWPSLVLAFQRANRWAAHDRGFLRSSLLLEGPRVGQILEMWSSYGGWTRESEVGPPIGVSQRVVASLGRRLRAPIVARSWDWHLSSASRNLNWADFDFRRAISEATRLHDEQ